MITVLVQQEEDSERQRVQANHNNSRFSIRSDKHLLMIFLHERSISVAMRNTHEKEQHTFK